jgi:hypothetical protein
MLVMGNGTRCVQEKGCQLPDLITFNTIVNVRTMREMQEGIATPLVQKIQSVGLQPDAVTYNTLISACSAIQRKLEHYFQK